MRANNLLLIFLHAVLHWCLACLYWLTLLCRAYQQCCYVIYQVRWVGTTSTTFACLNWQTLPQYGWQGNDNPTKLSQSASSKLVITDIGYSPQLVSWSVEILVTNVIGSVKSSESKQLAGYIFVCCIILVPSLLKSFKMMLLRTVGMVQKIIQPTIINTTVEAEFVKILNVSWCHHTCHIFIKKFYFSTKY